ncbi:MAG: hypothetical protein GXP26_07900 [Planctomycetes bacterium]|nr:hypothetical protein [Planctomycetota bacterium]
MRPSRYAEESESSQDSFLDVIANVVGVLIILVMLVGVRASQRLLVADTPPADPSIKVQQTDFQNANLIHDMAALREELDQAKKQVFTSQSEIQKVAAQVIRINHEASQQDQQRNELVMHRALIEEDLENRRGKLDSKSQREFDVQRQLIDSQIKLEELTREQMALIAAPSTTEEIESVPTPLAKTVEDAAIHLRVKNGLVSIVPLEELLSQIEYRADDIRRRLQSRNKVVETIGPINGYRLRFTVAKRNGPGAISGPLVGQRQRVVLEQFAQILPTSERIGQNVEQALMPGAVLYKHLQDNQRQHPAVVVWLYTDSFEQFRPLKRKLWEMGFSLATRPLPPGAHIGASPHGTKSAAQ